MKKILLLFSFFMLTATGLYAQVGIGTKTPLSSAQLDIKATDKGVLIPRVKLTRLDQFAPVTGTETNSLLVYNISTNTSTTNKEVYPGYYYWYNGAWNRVISQVDFKEPTIVNQFIQGSNMVTYDPDAKKFDYAKSGSSSPTAIDLIAAINSNTNVSADSKINPGMIQQGTETNSVLTTKVDATSGKLVTSWQTMSSVVNSSVSTKTLSVSNGLKITSGSGDGAVLKDLTIGVESITAGQIYGVASNTKDKLLVSTGTGSATWTSVVSIINNYSSTTKVNSKQISGKSLTTDADGGIVISNNGTGAVLTATTINIKDLPVSRLAPGNDGDMLVSYTASGTTTPVATWSSVVSVINNTISNTTNVIKADKVEKKALNLGDGLVFSGTTNTSTQNIVLATATIVVQNLPVDKLAGGTTEKGKILTVDSNGKPKWETAQNAVASSTVSATNGLSVSKTKSATIIKLGGEITTDTTIKVTKSLTLSGLKTSTEAKDDDDVLILDKNGVLRTADATAFKGNGDYVVKTATNTKYTEANDQKTGNKFEDGSDIKTEYIRTVKIYTDGTKTYFKAKALNVGDPVKVIITGVRIFGAQSNNRMVFSSSYEYSVDSSSSEGKVGVGMGGMISTTPEKGTYYVVIKYAK